MARPGRIATLITLGLVAAVGVLFTVQNSGRMTDLSLDLGFTAFHLAEPQPLPYLLWGAFGIGLLLAGTWGVFQRMGVNRHTREFETHAARSDLQAQDDDWT